MALLPITGLENHPVGTTGLNGIVNGNWERLESMFSALASANSDGQISFNSGTKSFTYRAGQAALTYAATTTVPFNGAVHQTLALTGNVTLASSNLAAGRRTTLVITSGASLRNLTFPAGWVFVGAAAPASIDANKTAILELVSTSAADSGVVARYAVQP